MEQDELKAIFPKLKKWYGPMQTSKYGDLPLFWQDLTSWSCLRSVLRAFEQDAGKQQSESSSPWSDYTEQDAFANLSLLDKRLLLARIRFEDASAKLSNVTALAQEAERNPNRSPSPDPVYNNQGKRMNTREVRMRAKFTEAKKQYLEEMLRLKPLPEQPQLASTGSNQIKRKIYIPVKDFPGRNFIGLIIGPRGDTQKTLERETGCKIAIRGKGSVKNGRQGKNEDETDELHVLVMGDTEDAVELASSKVELLLRPLDDSENEHKQKQLRDLAIYNGTFRDTEGCHHCNERGHKQWECPKRRAMEAANNATSSMGSRANAVPLGNKGSSWQAVQCRFCGETSHPSADCPVRPPGGDFPPSAQPVVDQGEFNDFWNSLNPTSAPPPQQQQPQQYLPPMAAAPYYPPPVGHYVPPSPAVMLPQPPTMPPLPPPPTIFYPPPPPSFPEPPPLPPAKRH